MQIDFYMFRQGMFSPYNYEFFNTSLYEKYKDQVICSNFMRTEDVSGGGYFDIENAFCIFQHFLEQMIYFG